MWGVLELAMVDAMPLQNVGIPSVDLAQPLIAVTL
jgi:hypothetical protein